MSDACGAPAGAPGAGAPIEILAPVGGAEQLRAAVWAGADCVYLGLRGLNARRGAAGFDAQGLKEAVAFCHGHGVGVHVTLNTLVHTDELPAALRALKAVCAAGADALLVQDAGVAELCRRCAPALPLHASTQAAVYDLAGAQQAAAAGFARVVLARELTLEEIALITARCGIQTEVFIHGALCMSVSGQCYLSAFFGGRSGNRGACAQPCRLPCAAAVDEAGPKAGRALPAQEAHHLSLKDLSALRAIPQLAAMGVASVKIEGRLRPPEYVAAAVHAARCARDGLPYDEERLQALFSRQGFTDGFLSGRRGRQMFGFRRAQDAAVSRAAAPAVRELYRRPLQRLDTTLTLTADAAGVRLQAAAGGFAAAVSAAPPAAADAAGAPDWPAQARRCLRRTGGTPFFVPEEGVHLAVQGPPPSTALLRSLRRQALGQLYALRAAVRPLPFSLPPDLAAALRPSAAPPRPMPGPVRLVGRFARPEQLLELPAEDSERLEAAILPLAAAADIPPALRERVVLEVPRGHFGDSAPLQRALAGARALGYTRFEANNIGHLYLLRGLGGCEIWGGWPLNVQNTLAAARLRALGVRRQTLGCEVRAGAVAAFWETGADVAVVGYGHLPLMLTRACPLQNVTDCAHCPGRGHLTDRTGRRLPVVCHGAAAAREIFNPVPLWLGDRQAAFACRRFVLYFTHEAPAEVSQLLRRFAAGQPLAGPFTRGLYFVPQDAAGAI